MSLKIDDLEQILLSTGVDKETHNKIIAEAEAVEAEKKAEREGGKKKSKYKYTVLLRADKEIQEKLDTCWVVKTLEDLDDNLIVSKLQEASGAHNAASSRKKSYITLWSELFEFLKRKFSKEVGVNIITKTPVRILFLEKESVGETPVA